MKKIIKAVIPVRAGSKELKIKTCVNSMKKIYWYTKLRNLKK